MRIEVVSRNLSITVHTQVHWISFESPNNCASVQSLSFRVLLIAVNLVPFAVFHLASFIYK